MFDCESIKIRVYSKELNSPKLLLNDGTEVIQAGIITNFGADSSSKDEAKKNDFFQPIWGRNCGPCHLSPSGTPLLCNGR